MTETDLLVIGGGINGVGIARDAVGRGLSVLLCEQGDLAQHTSSASTKLIHGGLRYLENYDFRLVRHALSEREILLRAAPHIIWPLRFVLPHHRALRPQWLIRIGLFLYDHIGGRKLLPKSRRIDLRTHVAGAALKPGFDTAFEYSDCWVQDARLVVLNAMDARERGADIRTRTRCTGLQREAGHWLVKLQERDSNRVIEIRSRAVVNAAGPWVERVLKLDSSQRSNKHVRLVKGSHIVVPKLFEHDYPYIFQNGDGRVLFAVPYEHQFTLLGTTDLEVGNISDGGEITPQEVDYICEAVDEYLDRQVTPKDVVWSYAGVRPLYDDDSNSASKVTRDYKLDLDLSGAPILSVFGGKITTYRELAQEALRLLADPLQFEQPDWTAAAHLPGGDFEQADFDAFLDRCRATYSWLPDALCYDYARNYGTRIDKLLTGCKSVEDLGLHFDGPLYGREVEYLMQEEFAQCAEDVLWRRSKKGLFVSAEKTHQLEEWMRNRARSATN